MALHLADYLNTEDDAVAFTVARQRHGLQRRTHRVTVEALAWAALVLLSFGPLIGYLLATLL
jgi:hypothetical protein